MEKYLIISAVIMASTAAISDIATRRIPNWLTYPGILGGVSGACAVTGWSGLKNSVFGILLAGGVLGLLFMLGGLSGGDVKLAAGIGAWMGPQGALMMLVVACMAAGSIAIAYVLFDGVYRHIKSSLDVSSRTTAVSMTPAVVTKVCATRLPFGFAIAIGTVVSAGNLWR